MAPPCPGGAWASFRVMRLVSMRLGLLIAMVVFVLLAASVYATRSAHAGGIVLHVPGLQPGDTLCASIWGWAPNGSIVELAAGCGKGGRLTLPFQGLRGYLKAWYVDLRAARDSPDSVRPGVIAAIAVTRPGHGIYGYIKALPVDIARTLLYKRLAIDLTASEARRVMSRPLVAWKTLESLADKWPPRTIPGGKGATWVLEDVYYSRERVPVPVSIVRLAGDLAHFRDDYVELMEHIELSYEERVVFEAIAGITSGPFTPPQRWEAAGAIFELTPPTAHTYLELGVTALYGSDAETLYTGQGLYVDQGLVRSVKARIRPMGPSRDVLVSVGFLGDVALAGYCLKVPLVPGCQKTALVALTRPRLYLDLMYYWYEVDNNPEDGRGVAENIFRQITETSSWTTGWNRTVYGDFIKLFKTVDNDYHTAPELSISLPVGAVIKALEPDAASLPVLPAFSATLGTEHGHQGISIVYLGLRAVKDEDIVYDVRLLHPYQPVYYDGDFYKLGAAYCDVDVIKPGSRPAPPGGGYTARRGRDSA